MGFFSETSNGRLARFSRRVYIAVKTLRVSVQRAYSMSKTSLIAPIALRRFDGVCVCVCVCACVCTWVHVCACVHAYTHAHTVGTNSCTPHAHTRQRRRLVTGLLETLKASQARPGQGTEPRAQGIGGDASESVAGAEARRGETADGGEVGSGKGKDASDQGGS